MRGRTRGLGAAALVDGDVDDHRARLHRLDGRGRDQLGRGRARQQHRADHQIGAPAQRLDRVAGGEYRAHAGAELIGDAPQRFRIAIDDGHGRAHAGADEGRVTAGDTAAENDHVGRRHARHAAQQHAAPAVLLLQATRADVRRHAAGDLRHRREQRQRALRAGHGLVGDRGHARRHQVLGLLAVGREMQVGEQDLAGVGASCARPPAAPSPSRSARRARRPHRHRPRSRRRPLGSRRRGDRRRARHRAPPARDGRWRSARAPSRAPGRRGIRCP